MAWQKILKYGTFCDNSEVFFLKSKPSSETSIASFHFYVIKLHKNWTNVT